MKVFISWSGERSKQVGEIFNEFIPYILQHCETFFSPEMDKGTKWFSEIDRKLKESDIGIICLTTTNINEPWILFESGALSNKLGQSRVCTFLLDLEPTDIKEPLSQFNATKNNKEDIFQLFKSINSFSDNQLKEPDLYNIFETFWNKIETSLKSIHTSQNQNNNIQLRSDRELLEEALEILRKDRITKQQEERDLLIEPMNYLHKIRIDSQYDIKDIFNSLLKLINKEKLLPWEITTKHNQIHLSTIGFLSDDFRNKIHSIEGIKGISTISI